jgi:hypothetical protein
MNRKYVPCSTDSPGRCDVLVDLRGADGFYAVGMVERGHFRESHCFEIQDDSRANIAAIAADNGVAERVHLYGAATSTFALVTLLPPASTFVEPQSWSTLKATSSKSSPPSASTTCVIRM